MFREGNILARVVGKTITTLSHDFESSQGCGPCLPAWDMLIPVTLGSLLSSLSLSLPSSILQAWPQDAA